MAYFNDKPVNSRNYPTSVCVWLMAVYDFYMQVDGLTAVRISDRFSLLKKEDWRSAWKTAKALNYFYQNEVKPRYEKQCPELEGKIQKGLKQLNDSVHDLKALYRDTSRKKQWFGKEAHCSIEEIERWLNS